MIIKTYFSKNKILLMKNLYITYLLLALSFSTIQAQEDVADSLKQILKTHHKTDSTLVKLYRNISYAYSRCNFELGLKYADSTMLTAKKLNSDKWMSMAYQIYGLNYWDNNEYDKALEQYGKAIKHSKAIGDFSTIGLYFHHMGMINNIMGRYKTAIDHHHKAYEIFTTLNEEYRIIAALNSIGSNYLYLSNYEKAVDYYLKTLKIAEENDDKEIIGVSLQNIGLVYKRMNNYSKAAFYFEKALAIQSKIKNYGGLINTYNLYGSAKDQNGDYLGAIILYEKGLALTDKINNERLQYDIINNLGISYLSLKDYSKAFLYLKKSSNYYQKTNNVWSGAIANTNYAKTILKASDDIIKKEGIKDKYAIAVSLLKESIENTQKIESINEEMHARKVLSEVYEKSGDYKNALYEYKQYNQLRKQILNNENKEEILKKELQYESEKKESLAKAEIARQKIIKNSIIFISSVLLLSGIFLFAGFRKRQKIKSEQKELLLRSKIADTEHKALRAQMNPHFIFNSLNSIGDYIHKNDLKSADYYLAKFAKLMRGILESSEEKEIPLAEEIKIIEIYMQLEASRLKNKFLYEIKLNEDIDPQITIIPPLIIQPFIENSIWHGLSRKEGTGKILIEITKENGLLNIKVEDDGVGRQHMEIDKKSYGVKLTKDRIELLNKSKSASVGVFLTDLEKGTKVEIKLPLIEEEP